MNIVVVAVFAVAAVAAYFIVSILRAGRALERELERVTTEARDVFEEARDE